MNLTLLLASALCVVLGVAFWVVFRKLVSPERSLPVSVDWIQDLSAKRYRPMERLLDDRDLRFLQAQPGYTPRLAKKLRSERRKIFRGYLRSLQKDFGRTCTVLELLMVQSTQDRPDLAAVVFKQRALFAFGLLAVQYRLALHACGLGTVDVRNLVGALDAMGSELQRMIPAANASAA